MYNLKGYYSLVQYCPDPSRSEAANIGVLLFVPEKRFIQVRFSGGNDRVRRFFQKPDLHFINDQKRALQSRIDKEGREFQTVADLEKFVGKRANEIVLTTPRTVRVTDATVSLEELCERLVGGRNKPPITPRLQTKLSDAFSKAGVINRLKRSVEVDVPILGRKVVAPFGYKNGRFNLIEPLQFDTQNPDSFFEKLCRRAIEGETLYQHRDAELGKLRMVVVGEFAPGSKDQIARTKSLLEDRQIGFHPFNKLKPLLDDIRESAHQ